MKKNRLLFFLSIGLVFCAMVFTCETLSKKNKPGFSVAKIRSSFTYSPNWDVAPPSEIDLVELRHLLEQDFNYLGSGAQCYAFMSGDGKYVLKFFKIKHLAPKTWLKFIPLPGLGKYRFKKIDKRILRREELFTSYKMAYEKLRDETGLVYIHLNKGKDLGVKVKLFDRMRNRYLVNLDKFEFIVQKKTQLVPDRITSYMQRGKRAEAVQAIRALLDLVVIQCKKGFVDKDTGISHNYGYVGAEVIHFDVGRIKRDYAAKDPSHYQREVLRIGHKLEKWLAIHYPILLPDLEEQINGVIGLDPEL